MIFVNSPQPIFVEGLFFNKICYKKKKKGKYPPTQVEKFMNPVQDLFKNNRTSKSQVSTL